ncbi:MAG TPA: SDR family oxidoreductase [Sneathiellales bacterium]|jgi:3-oxoacyl-[acyl-carrier protein] reductase|nr:SDR family oxidoreductase [Sneathiellales bacterium]
MNTRPETKKICLVTGAARGLGAAIATHLFNDGYWVAVSDMNTEAAAVLAKSLDPQADRTLALTLDVTHKSDFELALDHIVEVWGGVAVLVNNAAITKTTPLFEISPEEFDEVVRINMRGVFLGCQVFGAYFATTGYGRIINMASLAAQTGGAATGAHYAASKGGIVTLTKVFARELATKGVTVNAIAPGPLDVPLVHEILPPEKLSTMIQSIPVGHLGDPNFVGRMVALLASEDASSVTGATFDVNGGLYVR